jgi:hypothetical protein
MPASCCGTDARRRSTGAAGKLINDPRVLARRYLRRWFTVDVVATLPFEAMFKSMTSGSNDSSKLALLAFLKARTLLRNACSTAR